MLRTYAPRLARDPHARGRGHASQPASAPPLRRRRSSATEQRVVRARRPDAPWTSDRRGSPPRVAQARAARGSNSWRDLTSRYGLHRARPDHCRAPRRARGRTSAPPSLPRAIRWRRASGSRADRGDVRGRRAYRCSDIEAHGPEDDHIGAPPSCHGLRSGRAPTRARSIGSAGRSTDSTSRRGQRTLATVLSSTRGALATGAHTVSVAANGPFPAPAERRPGTSPSTRNLPTSALRRRRFRRGVRSVCPGG